MDSLEQKIKEYVSSVEIPDRVKPEEIKKMLEDNAEMTAGVFLRKLKELKISGSDFLELLGNSKIGNMEFRRIEENPHLKFDELLQILDNSVLSGEDYRMIIAVANQRKELAEQRKRREEETLRRMTEELAKNKNVHKEENDETKSAKSDSIGVSENTASAHEEIADDKTPENTSDNADINDSPDGERISAAEALILRMQNEIDAENSVENVNNKSDYTDSNTEEPISEQEDPQESGNINTEPVSEETDSSVVDTQQEENAISSSATESEIDLSAQEIAQNVSENADFDRSDSDDSKSNTLEFVIPDIPFIHEQQTEEAEDFDGIISDDEKIGSNAREIGNAIGELMDGGNDEDADEALNDIKYDVNDDDDYISAKRSKGCLITSFVGAALLIAVGLALNTFRAYGIIPELTYDIPEKINQEITDYDSLIEQAKAVEGKVSYTLPDSFVTIRQERPSLPKNVYGDTLIATVKETEICGAKEADGKLSGNFSFETELTDVGIITCGEYFAVLGSKDGATVIRTYDESGMISGKAVEEYILSGELIGYYTDGSRIFTATKDEFDLNKADINKPETYAPYYIHDGKTTGIPFENLISQPIINRLNYYTATRITPGKSPDDGGFLLRSVITGDSAGYTVSDSGMYVADMTTVNNHYYTMLAFVMFDESLSNHSIRLDDTLLNPGLLTATDTDFAAVGVEAVDGKEQNILITTGKTLGSNRSYNSIASGQRIAGISAKGKNVTVTTYGDDPMQYTVNISTGREGDLPEDTHSIAISDKVTAEVKLKADKDGNREGITLAVGGDKKAEVTITAESNTPGDWNSYLTSPVCDDISELAYYEKDGKIIVGIPIMYFDGISQVSICKFYSYADGKLSELGNITLYDEKYTTLDCEIIGGDKPYILTMWDNRVITADIDKVKIISDIVLKTVEKKDTATESKTESGNESKTESKTESSSESKSE